LRFARDGLLDVDWVWVVLDDPPPQAARMISSIINGTSLKSLCMFLSFGQSSLLLK